LGRSTLARYPNPYPTLATARAQNNTNGQMMINNCTLLTVTGATLYYVTPPFTQATIVDISPDQLTWTVQARRPRAARRAPLSSQAPLHARCWILGARRMLDSAPPAGGKQRQCPCPQTRR
jgi:hypothetical protein